MTVLDVKGGKASTGTMREKMLRRFTRGSSILTLDDPRISAGRRDRRSHSGSA